MRDDLETYVEQLRTLERCELVRVTDVVPAETPQEVVHALYQGVMRSAMDDAGQVLVAFLARRGRAYTVTIECVWRKQGDGSVHACVVLTAVDADPRGTFSARVLEDIACTVAQQMREER